MSTKKNLTLRMITRIGLLGGTIMLYFSVIGMVEAFDQRNLIGTFLTLGDILLFTGAIGASFYLANQVSEENSAKVLGAGFLVGAIASLLPLALIFINNIIDLRSMFISVSPGLVDILTYGMGLFPGSLALVVVSGVMGVFGAGYTLLSERIRKALTIALGWTLGLGIFSENASTILQSTFALFLPKSAARSIAGIVFSQKTLIPLSALAIFIIAFGTTWYRYQSKPTSKTAVTNDVNGKPYVRKQIIKWAIIGAILIILPWIVGTFLSQVLFMVGLYIMMGLGLNIVVGYAGLLDLGYVAFFAFGAYTMGILTTTTSLNVGGLTFWTALPIAVLVAFLFGVMLGFPVLRMRGDYLAIVTLGFGEIIRLLALSDWLAPVMGGAQGVLHIPKPVVFGVSLDKPEMMYYIVIAGSLLISFLTIRLKDSRLGRQWMAMREDEDVAEAMGINLVQTKLLAFAIGAGFSGLSGAIFASRLGNIFPHSFNLLISINVLALIIVGGLGSIPGVIIGSFILVGMPELLREFAEYRLLMYGILLIVMMLTRPEGFLPAESIKREFHMDEEMQSAEVEA